VYQYRWALRHPVVKEAITRLQGPWETAPPRARGVSPPKAAGLGHYVPALMAIPLTRSGSDICP
jgi:hypothetical protein